MATGAGPERVTESERAILIELEVGRIERPDRPMSRWTALAIAIFTGFTGLGLGASVVLPSAIVSAPSQRSERSAQPGILVQTPSGSATTTDRRQPPPTTLVQATARVVTLEDGGHVVRIAGQAAVTVRSLDATLVLGGRTVAGATVTVPSEATLTPAAGPTGVGAAPWSIDLALPTRTGAGIDDAVVTVKVGWPASPSGPGGALVLVVSLGDGRGPEDD